MKKGLSRKFQLKYNGKYHPPKYIISIASKCANGRELRTSEFSGGSESINFLRALGFEIADRVSAQEYFAKPIHKHETKHGERCPECKERVKQLLERIYGAVQPN